MKPNNYDIPAYQFVLVQPKSTDIELRRVSKICKDSRRNDH